MPRPTPTAEVLWQRFWSKVTITPYCWLWGGRVNNHGYGRLEWYERGRRKRVLAHRYAYMQYQPLVSGIVLLHRCDTPACVNPRHLQPGTQADNIRDALAKGRLNTEGLKAWKRGESPPRPCRRCAAVMVDGCRIYCRECKKLQDNDSRARYIQRMKGHVRSDA